MGLSLVESGIQITNVSERTVLQRHKLPLTDSVPLISSRWKGTSELQLPNERLFTSVLHDTWDTASFRKNSLPFDAFLEAARRRRLAVGGNTTLPLYAAFEHTAESFSRCMERVTELGSGLPPEILRYMASISEGKDFRYTQSIPPGIRALFSGKTNIAVDYLSYLHPQKDGEYKAVVDNTDVDTIMEPLTQVFDKNDSIKKQQLILQPRSHRY